ncbi:MAG: PTS sugar transporter subunit IIB [Culicoidibacterales bacterium]
MKIMLVCYGGLSTSILVNNMKKAIEASEKFRDKGIVIEAWGKEEYFNHIEGTDIILLGPQLSMGKEGITEELASNGLDIPVAIIDKADYGAMNAVPILKAAFTILKDVKNK